MSGKIHGWSEMLRSGGSRPLFESYPSDKELAEKLAGLFPGSSPSEEDVSRDRKRYFNRPQRGEVIEEQEASPTKNVILNKASQINLREALAEILDNIFDNYQRNALDKLRVEIIAYPPSEVAPGEILIYETSGGIERNRVVPLIQLGLSDRTVKGIGAWGEGFKMAAFALGEEVEIFSTYPREEPIGIHFPKGWLNPDHLQWKRWKVNTYTLDSNPPDVGSTVIRIAYLHENILEALGLENDVEIQEEICHSLSDYFGEIYSEKFHELSDRGYGDIAIRLSIGESNSSVHFKKRVIDRLIENLAFIPWLPPVHWSAEWHAPIVENSEGDEIRQARLKIDVYAGLSATFGYSQLYSKQTPGVEMWGNGRLFSLKGRIADESVGWGHRFGGSGGTNPKSNASSRRLTIVALFRSDDSRDIPWAAPVKTDYNSRSEFYAEIKELLAKTIRLYKDGVRLIESRLLPYSFAWTKMSDQEKLDALFADSDGSDEFKQTFATTRFGSKILSYTPDFSFLGIEGSTTRVSVSSVMGISTAIVKDIVKAASETKESATDVVQLLRALFPALAKQADLEEEMGLSEDEELIL